MQRREVFEIGHLGDLVRILAIDRLDTEQREISLALLGRANLALNDMAIS